MVLILTDSNGNELRELDFLSADFDLIDTFDFEVVLDYANWRADTQDGGRIFCPNTEYGGIIKEIITDTAKSTITLKGYTWRGYLEKRIIEPPANQDYRIVSGEANQIIRNLIDGFYDGIIKGATAQSGCTLNTYKINRYTTARTGLQKALATKNYRIDIKYIQGEQGASGYAKVSAVPIVDYSNEIELSQDSRLNFVMDIKNNCVNHLIALGDGQLAQRNVLHLYLQQNGTIGTTKYYTGINEIVETYELSNSEDLLADAMEHFEELISSTSFIMDVERLALNVGIGDIIGGRDYITGHSVKKALAGLIVTNESIEYRLEE